MTQGPRSTGRRPAARRALQGLPFPAAQRQALDYAGRSSDNLAARQMRTCIPEMAYHRLDQMLLEVFVFQQRIRERDAQQTQQGAGG